MPDIRIPATTEAAESKPFEVRGYDLPMGVSGWGFTGTDQVVIHRNNGNGFVALTDADSIIDADAPNTSITSTGLYKLVKAGTDGAVGASTD